MLITEPGPTHPDAGRHSYLYEGHFVAPPPLYLDSLFFKVQGPTPPLPEGRLDFPKSPRSNPPSQRVGWTFGKVQGPTPP